MNNKFYLLKLIIGFVILTSNSSVFATEISKDNLIKQMQDGGLVFYIRHASTEKDYADQVKADVNDGSTQRVLSEKGWHEAVHIGTAFRFYNIPVGKVLTSQYFRAWQTAWLAFGKYKKTDQLNFLPFEEYNVNQTLKMKNIIEPILSKKPSVGENTVIVAHDDPFEAATNIYPKPQGVCYVIKPQGNGKFSILGKIRPGEWR
jgi:phosphohistidine phosphatase SixA